jgi:hypothetical protein
VVVTEKDLLTKPVVKKPKTLNPLGAIFFAGFIGGGHALILNGFIKHTINIGLGALGVILVLFSTIFAIVAISLSAKIALFMAKFEPTKTVYAQYALQIMYFYIGFVPIYGFSIVYFEKSLALWKILIITLLVLVTFASLLYLNIRILQNDKARLSDLKKLFYQPKKIIVIALSFLVPALATILVLFI